MPDARNVTDDQIKHARALRRKKMTIEGIAAEMGLSKSTIGRAVKGMKTDRRAAANKARADIEPPWLNDARRLLGAGKSRPQISVELNVAQTSVYRLLKKFGA